MAVRLLRWAPASALLAKSNLSEFIAGTLPLRFEQLKRTSIHGYPAVEWRNYEKAGWPSRLKRISIRPAFKWVIAWHIEACNRILGISLESKKPIDPNQITQISNNFRLNQS